MQHSKLVTDLASMIGGMRVGKSDDSSSITSGDSDYGTATGSTFTGTYTELSQYRQVSTIMWYCKPQSLHNYYKHTVIVSVCTVLYFYSIHSHNSHSHMKLYVHYTWNMYSLSLSRHLH